MPTLQELASSLNAEVRGNSECFIQDAQAIEKASEEDITFAGDEIKLRKLPDCRAGAVIVCRDHIDSLPELPPEMAVVVVEDAATAFIEVLTILRPQRPRPVIGVSAQAFVSPSAQVGEETNIHAGASIGDDVIIGERCDILPGVCIGPGCRIGDDVTLYPNVVLYGDVVVGNHVQIHACSVIGADGFGYKLIDGRHVKTPHFGSVRIDDHVEIGASTTIDRAMIGQTIIGEGTKIDNQVMIAHNCELGRHNLLVSQVGFAGSATTDDYVICGGQSGVADHVHVGEGSILAGRAAAIKDVPADATYMGVPARSAAEAIKIAMAPKKIPELRKGLRKLEAQVDQLSSRLDALSESGQSSSKPAA
jgi:UDP-3-O-[3-hydroxymyristoyl] glucosamine N-acyltransferase